MSQGIGMTEAETAEILAVLNAISPEAPAELVGSGWRETYAGNVTWTFRGWTVVVFNDCMGWDYLDAVTAPDGRRWDFDEMADLVRFWTPAMDERRWPSLESDPPAERWASVVREAVREIQTQHGAGLFDDGRPQPLTNAPARQRIMPSDHIPVLAEDVAGAAARIADLEHQLARTQARLAEELARRARREPA